MRPIPALDSVELSGRTVFLRADLNVPMHNGKIVSDARIRACLQTIRTLLAAGARVAVASHLGRPSGPPKRSAKGQPHLGADGQPHPFSMMPVADRLAELLEIDVMLAGDCIGDGVKALMHNARPSQLVVLENLRYHPEEEANDSAFARALAAPFEIYVNDAFGAAHRRHASIDGIVKHVRESVAGPLLVREVEALGQLVQAPKRPFVAIVGGAKVADKLGVIGSLLGRIDTLLLGGAMAYTFMRAQGQQVGASRVEEDRVRAASDILKRARDRNVQVVLPLDHVASRSFEADAEPQLVTTPDLPAGMMGLDIGPQTRAAFAQHVAGAATVFWNGPLGVCEWPQFAAGTQAVARAVGACRGHTVVGGGDSVAALEACGLAGSVAHLSTGGGAALELLQHGTLPGIEALRRAG